MARTATDGRATARQADREQVRRAAHLLDSAFRLPGTNRRFGIDGLLGLIPGLGDAAGLALSTAIIVQAVRLGARGATVARMVMYAAVDAAFGSIPVLGSIFDFAFKANSRNVALLERHTVDPEATQAASAKVVRRTLFAAVAALVLLTVALVAVVVWLLTLLF